MKSLCLLVAVLLVGTGAAAQSAMAELRGAVVDQQGSVLPDVVVVVRNESTGTFRESRTGEDGSYFVSGLTPGTYELRATLAGFKTLVRSGVLLGVGRTTTVNLTLMLGSITESVSVQADTPVLDVLSKALGGHVTSQELVDLPTVNRSFVAFVGLVPGIIPIPSDAFGADAISVSGIDPRNNNYLLDGGNNNDDFLGQRAGTQARTPIEAVQEFQVLTHQFDAEFGRATGAVVNAVTKHGSNELRGSAFAFFQDDALTSREYFARQNDVPKPDTEQQQFGGTIGGPVVRSKAHFFASLERVRADRAVTVNIPDRPALNAATTTRGRVWNTIGRVDQQVSTAHAWSVRWLRDSSPQQNLLIPAAGRQPTLAAAREEADVDQTLVWTAHSVIGNRRMNTLRLGFTREDVAFANPEFNANGRRQDLLLPTLQHPTFVDQQSDVGQARVNNGYSIDDTLSWFVPGGTSSHDIKFGVQYQFATAHSTMQGMLNGVFDFGTSARFSAADPATYPERLLVRVPGAGDTYIKGHFASAFVQDRWTLGRGLTLSLGLRYDLEVIPLRDDDVPGFADSHGFPVDKDNLAPRIGFAFAPGDGGRSVLRGGYGVFYDKTHFEVIWSVVTAGVFSESFIVSFPANSADPGPSRGMLPAEPLLRNGPTVDHDQLRLLFPPGTRVRNTGTVFLDSPRRRAPMSHQVSLGYARQIGSAASASLDYVHASGRDLLLTRDLNPGVRADTGRTSPVTRVNPAFAASVLQFGNDGRTRSDALHAHVERRFRQRFGVRVAYALTSSRGNTPGSGSPQVLVQYLDDIRLDANQGPTDFDRRHNLVVSGTAFVPGAGGLTVSAIARAMSGLPFSIIDSNTDSDRNGVSFDFLPAGSYTGAGRRGLTVDYAGGRNGAYGPAVFQLDLRAGYRRSLGTRTLEFVGELFNATNRAAFENPVTMVQGHPAADRRLTDFLVLRSLRPGAIPRTGQIGIRFAF